MNILTFYQQTEIIIATTIFLFIFLVYQFITNSFNLNLKGFYKVLFTSILFLFWFVLVTITKNYTKFIANINTCNQ